MCLRETMVYFYCRRRPRRLHIKHLNSSRLYSHMQLFVEAEPESYVNITVHTLFLKGFGLGFFWSSGAVLKETDKMLRKTFCRNKEQICDSPKVFSAAYCLEQCDCVQTWAPEGSYEVLMHTYRQAASPLSETVEENTERQKVHSLVDGCRGETPFQDFFCFSSLLAWDCESCPMLLYPHITILQSLDGCCSAYRADVDYVPSTREKLSAVVQDLVQTQLFHCTSSWVHKTLPPPPES